MSLEDRGHRELSGRVSGAPARDAGRTIVGLNELEKGFVLVLGLSAAVIVIPLTIVGVVLWRARRDPEELTTEDDIRRLKHAGKKGGSAGLAVEGLSQIRARKNVRTPLGNVPNLGGRLIPKDIGAARALYED